MILLNIKGEASSDEALLLFAIIASWLGCWGVGVCMSGDGKLVLWVHACVPRQLARLYNSGACFYKACTN